MIGHHVPTEIGAVAAETTAEGFRVLVMRELRTTGTPPAFAIIEQRIIRSPERRNRHGISFALAFRPEIMEWLITAIGRPGQRGASGEPLANPLWPRLSWHEAQRTWPDGICTIEWSVDISFQDELSRAAFAEAWRERLSGSEEALTTT